MNGMFLNYASYFEMDESKLQSIVDFILLQRMDNGGFNCKLPELKEVERTSKEFILKHQLYISDRTDEIINKNFLKLSYPSRWKYDILRALDYFRLSEIPFDGRMKPAGYLKLTRSSITIYSKE